ncbi:MAG: EAL domain-containing protein [Sedimenticola sp.]
MKRPLLISLLLFTIAEILFGWWLWAEVESTAQRSLLFHQTELATGIRSVVDSHQKLVEMGVHHLQQEKEILPLMAEAAASGSDEKVLNRVRGRLYRLLYGEYKKLQEQDIRVLQFVLPDGRSLLRFNRPDLYNDRISRDRPLIDKVLKTGKPGAAFENGRVYPGFRYAFPLYHAGRLVGVADFSLAYDGIRRSFAASKQVTGTVSQILLKRDLLEAVSHPSSMSLFQPSMINPDYIVEKEGTPLKNILRIDPLPGWIHDIDRQLQGIPGVQRVMSEGRRHSLTLCTEQSQCYSIAMHPVMDSGERAAAYIFAYSGMPEYPHVRNRALTIFLLGSILLLISGTALRRWVASRKRLQTVSQHMGEGMYVVDPTGRIIYTNPAACQILGYSAEDLHGANAHELFHEHTNDVALDNSLCPIRNTALGGEVYKSDAETFRCKSGDLLRIAVTSSPLWEEGVIKGAVVIFRDITAEYENRKRLTQADTALRQMAEGVLVADSESRIMAVNQAFTEITGYQDSEVLGKTPAILSSGRYDKSFYREMWKSIQEKGSWEGEIWNRRKSGDVYPEWLKITTMRTEDGELSGYVGVFSDITELKHNQKRLRDLAYHDQLTGLFNRAAFMELFEHALFRAQRHQERLALLFLDLDRFKRINDTLGHVIGDELLLQVAERLRNTLREEDEIARLGGDEFIIMLEDIPNHGVASAVAEKLIKELRRPFRIENKRLDITASIGISSFPEDGEDATSLMKHADAAMYMAKKHGRDSYRYFIEGMAKETMERFELEHDLHQALEKHELILYFQPKVAIPSGRIIGLESLVRWQHPRLGLLTPFHFLNVAEEAGLMQQLTEQVLHMSALHCAKFKQAGFEDVTIAVNLDAQFLSRRDAEAVLTRTTERVGINPQDLELEIVETAILQASHYGTLWERLADKGFDISIDDFGTGESSLARLKTIPVKTLKIDRSFVHDIEIDENDRAIVNTIIAMANTLGKEVIAEGVENEPQLHYLYEAGCRMIQGRYFSPPVPAEEVEKMLRSNHFTQQAGVVLQQ